MAIIKVRDENGDVIDIPAFVGPKGDPGADYVLTEADKAEIAELAAKLVEVPEQDSSQNVDLTGYAKEQWVQEGFQPKGNYLTEHQDISGKLDADKLPEAVNTALAQAKESGEFDGADGTSATHSWNGTVLTITSASGTSSADLKGNKGDKGDTGTAGPKGDPGADYVITDADKAELLAEVRATANQQTPLFANSLADCTDTSKVYVLPDGYLYGYILTEGTLPEITYESTSGGYYRWDGSKNDFIITSQSGYAGKLTNFIPVTPGDQLSYKGKMQYSGNHSYVWFDSSGKGFQTGILNSESSPTVITAPAGAAFLRCTSFSTSTVILEVKWVLCQAAAPTYRWASTGHAFIPADYENRILALESSVGVITSSLKGKKIIYDGDSICYGAGYKGGYAKIIAERTGGHYVNQAVGGARLVTKGSNSWHSVVDNLPNLPTDGDIYCFEGGINDYWTSGMKLGTVDYANFTGTLDTTTVCGALESIFRYALTNFVGKPVCFVITHKIQSTAHAKNSSGNTFKEYHDAMVSICEKYSIPFYDAFNESGLNGWNTAQNNAYLTGNTNNEPDGCHPNEDGYKRYYVPQLIQLFERIMPI